MYQWRFSFIACSINLTYFGKLEGFFCCWLNSLLVNWKRHKSTTSFYILEVPFKISLLLESVNSSTKTEYDLLRFALTVLHHPIVLFDPFSRFIYQMFSPRCVFVLYPFFFVNFQDRFYFFYLNSFLHTATPNYIQYHLPKFIRSFLLPTPSLSFLLHWSPR